MTTTTESQYKRLERDYRIKNRMSVHKEGITSENVFSDVNPSPNTTPENPAKIRYKGLKERAALMDFQRQQSPIKGMRKCALYTIAEGVQSKIGTVKKDGSIFTAEQVPDVELSLSEYGYSFSGLQTCKNPSCVNCSRAISMQRAERIQKVLTATSSREWTRLFLTFTIPRQDCPRAAAKEIQRRWKRLQDRIQYRYRRDGQRVEFAKALDVTFRLRTYGRKKTYHVHLHIVMVIEGRHSIEEIDADLIRVWLAEQKDVECQPTERGQYIEEIKDNQALSKYVAKMAGLGLELMSSRTKTGKDDESLALPQLMQAANEGNKRARFVYREYLEGMRKLRTCSFSNGWDELKLPESEGEPDRNTITIPPKWWRVMRDYGLSVMVPEYLFRMTYIAKDEGKALSVFRRMMKSSAARGRWRLYRFMSEQITDKEIDGM